MVASVGRFLMEAETNKSKEERVLNHRLVFFIFALQQNVCLAFSVQVLEFNYLYGISPTLFEGMLYCQMLFSKSIQTKLISVFSSSCLL